MTVFEKWARIPAKQPALFTVAVLAITVILSFSIYWGTFKYEYLDWDDNTLVEQNAYVMDPSWARTKAAFIPKMTPGPHLPLRATSYKFDLHVLAPFVGGPGQNHNTRAHYHHIVNTWLYALNGVLLFFLFRKLLNPWAAAIATLIWVAHPVHVEAVALGVGQSELLVGLLAAAMVIRYLDSRRRVSRDGVHQNPR